MGTSPVVDGVSVALDETAREASNRQVLLAEGPAREVRAIAAENGPEFDSTPFARMKRTNSEPSRSQVRAACAPGGRVYVVGQRSGVAVLAVSTSHPRRKHSRRLEEVTRCYRASRRS
jgi:hypothetical protein